MKAFGIEKTCSEKWSDMTPNAEGAFCHKCALNVIDFSGKSNLQVKQILRRNSEKELCGQISTAQEDALNDEFNRWNLSSQKNIQRAFLFSLLTIFGLSLFSCSDRKDALEIVKFQKSVKEMALAPIPEPKAESKAKRHYRPITEEIVAFPTDTTANNDTIYDLGTLEDFTLDGGSDRSMNRGGMSITTRFTTFLRETLPVDEYDESGNLIPKEFSALAFPNPTRDLTTLEIELPTSDNFTILLMDMNGKTLQTIHSGEISRGTFNTRTDLSEYPAGTYFIAISSVSFRNVVKVIKF